jgi:hypothetical protein
VRATEERGRTVTGLGSFTHAERDLLVRLPRWIVGAASAIQPDNAVRTHRELEAGFLAVANGRLAKDAFLTEVANGTLDVFDEEGPIDTSGVDAVLDKAGEAWQLLRARVTPADAAAYARWLLDITDEVISAARSDGVLGVGGVLISPAEQRFRDRLAQILA